MTGRAVCQRCGSTFEVRPQVGRGDVDRFPRHKAGREFWCRASGQAVAAAEYVVEEVSFEAVAEEDE